MLSGVPGGFYWLAAAAINDSYHQYMYSLFIDVSEL